jgi:hypothetical protein
MVRFISPATKYHAATFLKGRPDGRFETMTVAHWFLRLDWCEPKLSYALLLNRSFAARHDSPST